MRNPRRTEAGLPRVRLGRYVGAQGGLREHQLLAWLQFCHEPPMDEAEDLDETFNQIDTLHTQSPPSSRKPSSKLGAESTCVTKARPAWRKASRT